MTDSIGFIKTPPLVSVIIPCFNHGIYLQEAIDSFVAANQNCNAELIIIDDGSTDRYTINKLEELKQADVWQIITKQNGGVDTARNAGILAAKGKYILPLDADNKLRTPYLTTGVELMEKDDTIAVLYGNAKYFGEKDNVWKNQPFSLQRLLLTNFIDTCAIIRKDTLLHVGNYRYAYGYEDWDLWLRIAKNMKKFYYLDEICFDYRVVKGSMMDAVLKDKQKSNVALENIYELNKDLVDPAAFEEYLISIFKKAPLGIIGKIIEILLSELVPEILRQKIGKKIFLIK
jgi:glycosyltransferase involved in cell wall biosynthesis